MDNEIQTLVDEGLEEVSDDVVVYDEESGIVGCIFSIDTSEPFWWEKLESHLEEEGYGRGKRLATQSYTAKVDSEGIESLMELPYVEAAELVREVHPPE